MAVGYVMVQAPFCIPGIRFNRNSVDNTNKQCYDSI